MRKKALVTGASRGIGKAVSRMLAQEGYDLVLVCRKSESELKALGRELTEQYGVICKTVLLDVKDPGQVQMLLKDAGEIEVLVNNAGVSHIGLLTDMTVEQWREVIDTNLSALFYTCKWTVPGMVYRKSGKIINISSVWGSVGASMETAYSASKGGVNSFTKALAKELAPSNVQVNAIAFGMIDTEMNACFTGEERKALVDEIPADRMGTAEEAAEMVRQLLNAPTYLTGQVITMDGGWI